MNFITIAIIVIACIAIWNFFVSTKIVREHHVSLHTRYGRLQGKLGAGRYRFFGAGHEFKDLDLRLKQLVLQTQELTSSEGITIKATAVGLYRITDPVKLTSTTSDPDTALYTLVQLALRDLISGKEAEPLLSSMSDLSPELMKLAGDKAQHLGMEVTELVIRDIILPSEIKKALSEAWRAQKHSIAELESARGKAAATRTLANAAKLYEANPVLLQIRYVEALEAAAVGMGHTFVLGLNNDQALNFKS